VQHLAGLVDGLDVASALEMQLALDTVIDASHISFAGPGKTTEELARAVAAGVTIELESATEARRVAEIGERLGLSPRVAVRVNPDFQVKGSGMRMGGGPQQFGIDAEQAPELLRDIGAAGLDFQGFHVFAGSQNLHAEILCDAQSKTTELVVRLADATPMPVRYVNLGGGFGIPYFEKDTPLDLARIGENLGNLLAKTLGPRLPQARVTLELGRYIVGESGVYVTRVVDRKVSRGRTFIVVDGGLHHQLAASGNFGQVIRRNYPVVVGNRMNGTADDTVSIVGCLCTPLDLLADQVCLPRVEIDDLIVLFQAGAYGLSASPTAFLGHPMPAEMLV
jgi:diaminopimelate decarboxylase